jgi:hypothetical protein
MTGFSEQDSIDPDNPKRDYMTLSERAAKLGPLVSQGAMPEPTSSILSPALLAPNAIDQPARRTRGLDRRAALLSVATAVAAIVAVATLVFATTKPASRQSVATSIPSEITGSVPQTTQGDVESKPAPAELKAPNTLPASQLDEQSQQLLQRFLQWREKAAAKGGG